MITYFRGPPVALVRTHIPQPRPALSGSTRSVRPKRAEAGGPKPGLVAAALWGGLPQRQAAQGRRRGSAACHGSAARVGRLRKPPRSAVSGALVLGFHLTDLNTGVGALGFWLVSVVVVFSPRLRCRFLREGGVRVGGARRLDQASVGVGVPFDGLEPRSG